MMRATTTITNFWPMVAAQARVETRYVLGGFRLLVMAFKDRKTHRRSPDAAIEPQPQVFGAPDPRD